MEAEQRDDEPGAGETEDPLCGRPQAFDAGFRPIRALFWFVLSVGYIGFLPYASGVTSFVGWDSILLSESYGVAVAVSFLAIVAAWSFVDNVLARAKPRPLAAAAGIVVVSLLVVAVGLLKISVIIVVLAAAAFLWFQAGTGGYVTLNLLFVGVVLSSFAALLITSNPGYFSMPQSRLVSLASCGRTSIHNGGRIIGSFITPGYGSSRSV